MPAQAGIQHFETAQILDHPLARMMTARGAASGESSVSSDVINAKAKSGAGGRTEAHFHPDLAAIRAMSRVLPGAFPLAVNGVRVAASIRPRKFVIEGGDDTPGHHAAHRVPGRLSGLRGDDRFRIGQGDA